MNDTYQPGLGLYGRMLNGIPNFEPDTLDLTKIPDDYVPHWEEGWITCKFQNRMLLGVEGHYVGVNWQCRALEYKPDHDLWRATLVRMHRDALPDFHERCRVKVFSKSDVELIWPTRERVAIRNILLPKWAKLWQYEWYRDMMQMEDDGFHYDWHLANRERGRDGMYRRQDPHLRGLEANMITVDEADMLADGLGLDTPMNRLMIDEARRQRDEIREREREMMSPPRFITFGEWAQ